MLTPKGRPSEASYMTKTSGRRWGNISSCIWTWVAGTGNIPGSRTTDSTSAIANSHQFIAELFNGRDFKVGCTNDYGDYYEGQFSD